MPQKFAIPAFFGNPGVSDSVSTPPNPKYTNLVNPPTPTPPPPSGSIIVLGLDFQDGPFPNPTDANLVAPFNTVAQSYQTMGYIVLAYADTLWGTGANLANCPPGALPPPGPPGPDPEGCNYTK